MAPDHVEREADQHDTGHERDQVARGLADAERRQHIERDLHEGEPVDEDRRPDEPEPGRIRGHRQGPEALGARCQDDPAEDHDQPHDQEHQEVAEHDLLEQRRPIEQKEGADAADRKGKQHAQSVGGPHPDRAQTLAHGDQPDCDHALAEPSRRPPEQPLEAKAERREDGQKGEDPALPLSFDIEAG
jgi:hypothetical protein